ncbi:MAG: bactofilin family protein [Gemmatimonadota bacterium]
MAIFSSGNGRPSGAERRRPEPTTFSIVAPDMRITGDLETDGVVKVEGLVQGNVRAGAQVLVGAGARVEGDIETREAIVGGEVTGNITARERVEILATAAVTGDVLAQRLVIAEGGRVNGRVTITDDVGTFSPGEAVAR